MKLLAKSVTSNSSDNDKEALTLVGHLELGIQAALEFEQIARIICHNLDLNLTPEELTQTVAFATWIHDWGKVSGDFQAFVHSKSNKTRLQQWYGIKKGCLEAKEKQAIRHELLSLILAHRIKSLYDWLKLAKKVNVACAFIGVLTHHLKVKGEKYFESDEITFPLYAYINTQDFRAIAKLGVQYFNLNPKYPKFKENQLTNEQLQCWIEKTKSWCLKLEDCCKDDFQKVKQIAVVKALVMSADLAASALLEKETGKRTYTQWIQDALAQTLTDSELQSVIDSRLKGKNLLPFQLREKEHSARVLIVIAGCGAGKTLVPFVRFQRLIKEENLQAKMFFCYPTTATTSEGFKDYGLTTEEKDIALLIHSRVWVDYSLRFKDLMNSYDNETNEDDDAKLFQTKVEALRLWHSKLIFCTAHTVLGLLQNHRKGLYGFPAIAQGVFVFDEIHAYPPQLFGALLQFLRVFRNTPIVLMSASLTPAQQKAIETVLAENGETADILTGPKEIETLERYHLQEIESQDKAWDEIITELKEGGKVLWITNQVADSQLIYTEAKQRFAKVGLDINTIVYHSRFRYQDSIQQHEKLIAAFQGNQPAFAVTTQIAEMSLDISCTLLVSANAPMESLVQRLGRLNRWVKLNPQGKYELATGKVCRALIYPWKHKKPYELEQLKTGQKLVELLKDKTAICQEDSINVIAHLTTEPPQPTVSQWLQTWQTKQDALMSAGYTIQVILEDDVNNIFEEVKKSHNKPVSEAQKWAVSVTIPKNINSWERKPAFKFYRIAPTDAIHYHPEIGAYEPRNARNKVLKDCYRHKP